MRTANWRDEDFADGGILADWDDEDEFIASFSAHLERYSGRVSLVGNCGSFVGDADVRPIPRIPRDAKPTKKVHEPVWFRPDIPPSGSSWLPTVGVGDRFKVLLDDGSFAADGAVFVCKSVAAAHWSQPLMVWFEHDGEEYQEFPRNVVLVK
jgi:hypothetical protein